MYGVWWGAMGLFEAGGWLIVVNGVSGFVVEVGNDWAFMPWPLSSPKPDSQSSKCHTT